MQSEVTALTAQIASVMTDTEFNGNALFDHGTDTFDIQTGANAAETVTWRWPISPR